MKAPTLSVIICAYTEQRWDDLAAAVASVHAQTLPAHEIIVVVDHNHALFERARDELTRAIVVANSEGRGLSGARNSGVAASSGEVLVFLDDDAVAAPDWLQGLADGLADPEVLGVGGLIEPLWQSGRPDWFPDEFYWVVGCTYRGMPARRAPVRNLIGANMAIRREVFATVGGFRDGIGRTGTLPVGCEETELCIRAAQALPRRSFLFIPSAKVRHRVPDSRTTWAYFRARCYAEGRSKALVAHYVGAGAGLSSERSYTLRTLPLGVLRGLSDALQGLEVAGLARAGAIIAGLGMTTAGYLQGSLSGRMSTVERAAPIARHQP